MGNKGSNESNLRAIIKASSISVDQLELYERAPSFNATTDEDVLYGRNQKLICGYCRNNNDRIASKTNIIKICLSYYHDTQLNQFEFKWDDIRHGDWITLIRMENNVNISTKVGVSKKSQWGIAISLLIISSTICNEYSYEIQISNNSHKLGNAFMMGFVYQGLIDDHLIDWNKHLNVDNAYQLAFYVGNGKKKIEIYGNYKTSKQIDWKYDFKNNDRFRVNINLKKRNITLYYNDEYVDIIFENINVNKNLIPAVALCNAEITVTKSYFM